MNRKLIAALLVLFLAFSIGFAHAKPCEPKTYSNVSPDTFACMKTKLQDAGIHVPSGDSGKLSDKGVAATFVWMGIPILQSKLQTNRLLSAIGLQTTKWESLYENARVHEV